ncbi:hypothetical protein QFC22_002158 [Naganishia vaughanmartiniae]|uniref:Uncharacterized protein n=1 Tax=Naganishia vaughanmartiniae TaxID=1424756 RepID=A0ACC2XBW0_9TREE|nr:hypothetical protein QFC22_002158 [Naganishia vaughanmartiniae]
MTSPTNTPNTSRPVDRVFSPTSSPSAARRFDERDRASIISTSTKGWAPLNTKRSSILASSPAASPGGVSGLPAGTTAQGPRRTSSSFKHVRHNNLVSNSIFKSPNVSSGSPLAAQSSPSSKIGLGIGIASTRKTSGGASSSGRRKVSAGSSSGGRKVSGSTKNVINAGSTPRKVSLSEDLRTSNGVTPSSSGSPSSNASRKAATPRPATGLTNLASSGYVSRSPFLQHTSSFEGSTTPSSSNERNYSSSSPGKNSPTKCFDRMSNENGSPLKKLAPTSGSNTTKKSEQVYLASPISNSIPASRSDSSQHSFIPTTESTSEEMDANALSQSLSNTTSVSPGKSSLTSRRLRGPRLSDPSSTSQIYGSSTYSSSSISRRAVGLGGGPQLPKTVTFRDVADVKEFETGSSDGGEWEDDVEDEGDYEEGESWDEVLLGPPGSVQQHQRQQEQEARDREAFTENTPSPEMDLSGLRRYGSLNSRPSPAKSRLNSEMGPVYAEQEREEDEGYAGYIAGLGHQQHGILEEDESTTANFIDSLYADGYLSPPQSQSESSLAAQATSAAMSDSVRSNSIDEGDLPNGFRSQEAERYDEQSYNNLERDECGIPLGRTHHADRAVAAREVQRQHHEGLSVQQPALPRVAPGDGQQLGETMLRSGDVTVPAVKGSNSHRQEHSINAHQDGQFVDPFVTIQTATRVNYNDNQTGEVPATRVDAVKPQPRDEGGVPLGRTSHAERAKVARILATRGLGLGMPARPMVPFVLGGHRGRGQEDQSEDGSEGSDEEYDDRGYSIPDLSNVASQADRTYQSRESYHPQQPIPRIHQASHHVEEVKLAPIVSPLPEEFDQNGSLNSRRALPKPPKPVPVIGMPSPVEKGDIERNAHGGQKGLNPERVTSPTKVFGLSLPFSLPALASSTSPLFAGDNFKAASESGSEDSADRDMYDQEEPERELSLTPPPVQIFDRQQPPSPHRIPEFDFESPATQRNRESNIMDEDDPTTEAFKLVEDALPKLNLGDQTSAAGDKTDVQSRLTGLFGERKDVAPASTISSSNESLGASATQTCSVNSRVRQRISKDVIRAQLEEKRSMTNLATSRPIAADDDDVFLSPARKTSRESKDNKALPPPPAESIWLGKLESSARPGLRARQDTMSAEEVLQNVPEPKSALEQLVSDFKFTEFDQYAQASSSPPKTRDSFKLQQAPGVHVVRHATSENVLGNKVRSSQRLAQSSSGLALIEEASTSDVAVSHSDDITLGQDLLNAGSRPKRRRSMSTGDASTRGTSSASASVDNRMSLLDTFRFEDSTSILTAFEKELNVRNTDRAYKVREHGTVYASADDKIKHNKAGDVDKGRAWRQVRKASDINQYAKEIKAMKAKASNSTKSFGTIFVKVLGVESLNLPMPKEETSFCITLDNGIDYIRTPYTALKEGAKVNQEFALVEHANFEFALGVEIRRDAHINKMIQTNANPAPAIPRPAVASRSSMVIETGSIQSSTRGLKSLFQSPRKMSKAPKALIATEAVPEPVVSQDNIARYFTDGDSTVGRTHIAFKPIAKNCDARLLEIRYPMFGMHQAAPPVIGASLTTTTTHRGSRHSVQTLPRPTPPPAPVRKQVCKITLQIFRLPPLPGLTDDQLPQSIDECLRGMRHHAWHEHEYHQGVMTQKGGDCIVPRRRPFKLIGGNLIASNAVTKKTVFSIDLRKAELLVNENIDVDVNAGQKKKSIEDELEAGYTKMPRSFTLRFEDDDYITFWTDTDEEKAGWMKALGSLIGKVPSNPLWAELLAARQRHVKARSASKANLAAVAAGEEASLTTSGEQIKSPPPPAVPEK